MLVEIDPTDFRLAITQREAAVARAERLAQEQAEAEAALRAWRKLKAIARLPRSFCAPQINEARASIEAAKAMLRRARPTSRGAACDALRAGCAASARTSDRPCSAANASPSPWTPAS